MPTDLQPNQTVYGTYHITYLSKKKYYPRYQPPHPPLKINYIAYSYQLLPPNRPLPSTLLQTTPLDFISRQQHPKSQINSSLMEILNVYFLTWHTKFMINNYRQYKVLTVYVKLWIPFEKNNVCQLNFLDNGFKSIKIDRSIGGIMLTWWV